MAEKEAKQSKGKAWCRVLTSYQDNWVSHERNAIVEIDLDKITPGENLEVLTEAQVKAWRKKQAKEAAEAAGELVVEEEAA